MPEKIRSCHKLPQPAWQGWVTVGCPPLDKLVTTNVPRGTLGSPNLRRVSPSVDGRLSPLEPVAIGACTLIKSARSLTVIWSEYIRPSRRGLFARGSMPAHHFRLGWLATRQSIQKCATLWGGQFEGILENLTEKMNHQGHEGARRCPIEFLRVPSCPFVVRKTYPIESAAMKSTIL